MCGGNVGSFRIIMSGLHLCQCSYDNDIEGVKTLLRKKRINVNYRDEVSVLYTYAYIMLSVDGL